MLNHIIVVLLHLSVPGGEGREAGEGWGRRGEGSTGAGASGRGRRWGGRQGKHWGVAASPGSTVDVAAMLLALTLQFSISCNLCF